MSASPNDLEPKTTAASFDWPGGTAPGAKFFVTLDPGDKIYELAGMNNSVSVTR